jgi:hypothetical protein
VACFTQRIVSNRAGHRFVLTTDPWSLMNQLMQSQKYQIIANRRWCTFQRDNQFLGYRSTTSSEEMAACSLGLSATSQQYFSLRTNQPPATSQQYFSLRTNQHQPSASSQTNRLMLCRRCYHGCSCDFVSADHQIGFKADIYAS